MINIGGNPLMIILAIIAALGGVGLYFVRNFRPELARDHDVFFSAIALVYGIILLAFNFRMEITTQLAQVLVVGFAGWFVVESLILRQSLAEQARRSPMNPFTPDEEDDPVEPNYPGYGYRVELDTAREIGDRRPADNSRRMRSVVGQPDPSELGGDIRGSSSRSRRRPKNSEPVIDIDEDQVQDSKPESRGSRTRRPRNTGNDFSESNISDSDFSQSSARRRSRGRINNDASNQADGFDDF